MKKYLFILLGTLLFIAFIMQIGIKEIDMLFNSMSIEYIFSVILLNAPILLIKTFRWKILLSRFNISISLNKLLFFVSSGFFLGLVTPGTLGELGRTFNSDIEQSKGIGTVLFEKIFDLLSLLLLAASSLLFLIFDPVLAIFILLLISGIIFTSYAIFLKAKNLNLNWIISHFPKLKSSEKFNNIFNVLRLLLTDLKLSALSFLLSFSLWLITAIQFYILLDALKVNPSLGLVFICCFVPYLASVISFIPLGLGVLDFSMAGLMDALYGISNPVAYASTLSFRLFATLPLVLWGYCCYLMNLLNKRKIDSHQVVGLAKNNATITSK